MNDKKPKFVVKVSKDPKSQNIEIVQIVKGWADNTGEVKEKVFTIGKSENKSGSKNFNLIWTDKEFNENERSFYYVRALEVPSKRWTSFDQDRFGVDLSSETPKYIRERVYSSPIWYSPNSQSSD